MITNYSELSDVCFKRDQIVSRVNLAAKYIDEVVSQPDIDVSDIAQEAKNDTELVKALDAEIDAFITEDRQDD